MITTIFTEHYGEIDIKIIAEHRDQLVDFDTAEVYSIWNSADEPLGLFVKRKEQLVYDGDDLAECEQQQLADFINAYRTGEWDL